MYINIGAIVKTAIIFAALIFAGWKVNYASPEQMQAAAAHREALKTDLEKCIEATGPTDYDKVNQCQKKYGATHEKQKQDARYRDVPGSK